MKIKGRDINVMVDGKLLALSRSCIVSVECDITEIGDVSTAEWKKYISGRKGWSVDETSFVDVVGTDISLVGKTDSCKQLICFFCCLLLCHQF